MLNNYFIKSVSLLCSFLFLNSIAAQTITDSNLPIVIITTDVDPVTGLPLEILDDPRVLGAMKIIYHADGSRNYISDQNTPAFLNYNGRISIEIRGSTSQVPDKKPYGLTTLQANNTSNNNVSLLGMPSENDWILSSIAYDKSFIRDYLCYNLSRQMGNYASRTAYCEVIVNGDYKGLYLLQEKIKVDSNRVDILKMSTSDNSGADVTGGYITKCDKINGGDPIAWTMQDVNFVHHYPKPEDITTPQNDYIQSEFYRLAATTYNQSLLDGYKTVIDIPSFVDFMLVNELASNADVYQSSTFFHKDRNGKLRAGPVWDLNITFGSDFSAGGHSVTNQWQFSNGNRVGPDFWLELSDNGSFWCYFTKRWNELTQPGQPMNETVLNSFIDTTISLISEAMFRQEARWGTTVPDQATEIVNIKSWLTQRIAWMNSQLTNFSACSTVVTPPLVISKINYNPQTTVMYPVSNDQEFIEITNAGSSTIDLSGIYFSKLGTTYQFPFGTTITGNSSLFLASSATVFQSRYGFAPFGQYTRNLSNKSQNIVLADAMGNVIDTVTYFDSAPWPTSADGQGSYLQLIDVALDNNLASSWVPVSNAPLHSKTFTATTTVLFPNPVVDIVTVQSDEPFDAIRIFDVSGKEIYKSKTLSNNFQVDMSGMESGFYMIKILYSNEKVETVKVLKK